ncbi:MAG: TPM domain-containing protein [Clostridia bacterium]|nr:TPM domain-containing protein [Clostridia bacterium]
MRRFFAVIFASALVLSCFCISFAEPLINPELYRVNDFADIYTEEQEADLEARITDIYTKYDMDLTVYTSKETAYTDLTGPESWMNEADDFYDYNNFGVGEDGRGTCLFICMDPDNRGWWTSAKGAAMPYYTEEAINYIDDRVYPYMRDGDYYGGAVEYLTLVDTLYADGEFPYYTEYSQESEHEAALMQTLPMAITAGLIVGLVVGLAVLFSKKRLMKTVATAAEASEYLDGKSFNLRGSRDHFLFRSVTRTKIESRKSGGSSYSGGHRSSSGSFHSGGGRGF